MSILYIDRFEAGSTGVVDPALYDFYGIELISGPYPTSHTQQQVTIQSTNDATNSLCLASTRHVDRRLTGSAIQFDIDIRTTGIVRIGFSYMVSSSLVELDSPLTLYPPTTATYTGEGVCLGVFGDSWIWLDDNLSVQIMDAVGGIGAASAPGVITPGVYSYIEVELKYSSSTNNVIVYLNNVELVKATMTLISNKIQLGNVGIAPYPNLLESPTDFVYQWYDNIYISDNSGSDHWTRIGPTKVRKVPLSDTVEDNFDPINVDTNIDAINMKAVDNSSYNSAPKQDDVGDFFKLDLTAVDDLNDIHAIQMNLIYRTNGEITRRPRMTIRHDDNTTRRSILGNTDPSNFTPSIANIYTKPIISSQSEWDVTSLDSHQFGYEILAAPTPPAPPSPDGTCDNCGGDDVLDDTFNRHKVTFTACPTYHGTVDPYSPETVATWHLRLDVGIVTVTVTKSADSFILPDLRYAILDDNLVEVSSQVVSPTRVPGTDIYTGVIAGQAMCASGNSISQFMVTVDESSYEITSVGISTIDVVSGEIYNITFPDLSISNLHSLQFDVLNDIMIYMINGIIWTSADYGQTVTELVNLSGYIDISTISTRAGYTRFSVGSVIDGEPTIIVGLSNDYEYQNNKIVAVGITTGNVTELSPHLVNKEVTYAFGVMIDADGNNTTYGVFSQQSLGVQNATYKVFYNDEVIWEKELHVAMSLELNGGLFPLPPTGYYTSSDTFDYFYKGEHYKLRISGLGEAGGQFHSRYASNHGVLLSLQDHNQVNHLAGITFDPTTPCYAYKQIDMDEPQLVGYDTDRILYRAFPKIVNDETHYVLIWMVGIEEALGYSNIGEHVDVQLQVEVVDASMRSIGTVDLPPLNTTIDGWEFANIGWMFNGHLYMIAEYVVRVGTTSVRPGYIKVNLDDYTYQIEPFTDRTRDAGFHQYKMISTRVTEDETHDVLVFQFGGELYLINQAGEVTYIEVGDDVRVPIDIDVYDRSVDGIPRISATISTANGPMVKVYDVDGTLSETIIPSDATYNHMYKMGTSSELGREIWYGGVGNAGSWISGPSSTTFEVHDEHYDSVIVNDIKYEWTNNIIYRAGDLVMLSPSRHIQPLPPTETTTIHGPDGQSMDIDSLADESNIYTPFVIERGQLYTPDFQQFYEFQQPDIYLNEEEYDIFQRVYGGEDVDDVDQAKLYKELFLTQVRHVISQFEPHYTTRGTRLVGTITTVTMEPINEKWDAIDYDDPEFNLNDILSNMLEYITIQFDVHILEFPDIYKLNP